MYHFSDVIGYQQIVGSAVDIAIRLAFALKPSRMFKLAPPQPPKLKVTHLRDAGEVVGPTPAVTQYFQ